MEHFVKQTLGVSSFNNTHPCISIIQPVIKSDTMCWFIYCADNKYIWPFNCDLGKNY